MTSKSNPKSTQKPVDAQTLTAPEFRKFLEFFPDHILKKKGIPGYAFFGVGMALAQHCDYETGTRVRISQRGLARISRTSPATVRKVIDFLKKTGAIKLVDTQKRGGTPSENYIFRKTQMVKEVLSLQDQDYKPEGVHRETCAPGDTQCAPGDTQCAPGDTQCAPGANDKNFHKEEQEEPSSASAEEGVALELHLDEEEEVILDSKMVSEALASWSAEEEGPVVEPTALEPMDDIDMMIAGLDDIAPAKPEADQQTYFYQLANKVDTHAA